MRRRSIARRRPSTTVGSDGVTWGSSPDDGRVGLQGGSSDDGDDRCDLSEDTPHGF